MRFKIDENLKRVAAEMAAPKDAETVSVELCSRFVDAGMIEESCENFGKPVLVATGPRYVSDVCAILAGYLYGDESRSISFDVFKAFSALVVMGDGDCPYCGGEMENIETEGHEIKDGDRYTPNSYVIDNYVYECRECGEIIKLKTEL